MSGVVTTFAASIASSLLALAAAEPIALFDGRSLDGWDGAPGLWRVDDGVLVGETTAAAPLKANSFLIWRGGTVRDFRLAFRYRIRSNWANSGMQYRSRDLGDHVVAGYQADIESGTAYSGINYGERTGRGILAKRGTRAVFTADAGKPTVEIFAETAELQRSVRGRDQWNDYEVIADGPLMTHRINGVLMSETEDRSPAAAAEGILALQLHQGKPMRIDFKDLVLIPLHEPSSRSNP